MCIFQRTEPAPGSLVLRLLTPLVLARFSIATLLAVVTASLPAQPPSPGFHALRGVVHDSLTGAPLREALVQLVVDTSAEATPASVRAVLSDSLGRFHFDSIPTGRYRLGFFHDLLDGTGIAPVVQLLEIPRDLLVVGEGNRIAADGGVVASEGLAVDEALLTGESLPVEKDPGSQVAAGTLVVRGSGGVIVTACGARTAGKPGGGGERLQR